jgi:hypothetical protein
MKSTRKTAVRGTSSLDVGMPPRIAPSGAKGPTAFFPDTTIPAVDRPDVGEGVTDPIVNKSDEDAAVGSFSNLPAASPTSAAGACCGMKTLAVDGIGIAVMVIVRALNIDINGLAVVETVTVDGVSVTETVKAGAMLGAGDICVESKELCGLEIIEVEGVADAITDNDEIGDVKIDVTATGRAVAVTVFVATGVDECDPISRYLR